MVSGEMKTAGGLHPAAFEVNHAGRGESSSLTWLQSTHVRKTTTCGGLNSVKVRIDPCQEVNSVLNFSTNISLGTMRL